ncbi:sensor histidine kinase [Arthrobacter sp. ISL-28]|uniref:sensor histidine kinase n=1 Tax=Arthrobacter sp. ISL-28 TaxID=2819108 RepID=UPI001BEADC70|nr:histidine kinase [Arthrobacter sp. ISL-28]MBT2522283.1 sensor histidine kinase [Arthrobacter sp. ISL-28]
MTEALSLKDAPANQAGASFAELAARRRGRFRRYLHSHPRTTDALVAACYMLLVTPTMVDAVRAGVWLAAGLLAAVAVSLFLRRRYPVALVAFIAAVEVAVTLLHPWGSNVSAGLWFSLYAVAVVHTRRFALITLALATAPLALLYFFAAVGPLERELPASAASPEEFQLISSIAAGTSIALSNVLATGIGISVRQRREHEQEVAAWAAQAARLGSVNERNRIAREMHDVVAHSLTVMVTLSDGAGVVVRKNPERAAEVLAEMSRTGRTALADMRRVLGVLRDEAGAGQAPREPLAAGDNLAKLLDGFRTAGLPLHYSQTGPALPADAALQLTVYRIVQESLTNVLRYGRALSRVDVAVLREDSTVTIEVVDDGKATSGASVTGAGIAGSGTPGSGAAGSGNHGSGQGLTGMKERAGIYGGTVEAGRTSAGGWRVRAVLTLNGTKGEE